ncbi:ATP-binding protein [bacterium]|nr:ATP-binding protein [bacterium]
MSHYFEEHSRIGVLKLKRRLESLTDRIYKEYLSDKVKINFDKLGAIYGFQRVALWHIMCEFNVQAAELYDSSKLLGHEGGNDNKQVFVRHILLARDHEGYPRIDVRRARAFTDVKPFVRAAHTHTDLVYKMLPGDIVEQSSGRVKKQRLINYCLVNQLSAFGNRENEHEKIFDIYTWEANQNDYQHRPELNRNISHAQLDQYHRVLGDHVLSYLVVPMIYHSAHEPCEQGEKKKRPIDGGIRLINKWSDDRTRIIPFDEDDEFILRRIAFLFAELRRMRVRRRMWNKLNEISLNRDPKERIKGIFDLYVRWTSGEYSENEQNFGSIWVVDKEESITHLRLQNVYGFQGHSRVLDRIAHLEVEPACNNSPRTFAEDVLQQRRVLFLKNGYGYGKYSQGGGFTEPNMATLGMPIINKEDNIEGIVCTHPPLEASLPMFIQKEYEHLSKHVADIFVTSRLVSTTAMFDKLWGEALPNMLPMGADWDPVVLYPRLCKIVGEVFNASACGVVRVLKSNSSVIDARASWPNEGVCREIVNCIEASTKWDNLLKGSAVRLTRRIESTPSSDILAARLGDRSEESVEILFCSARSTTSNPVNYSANDKLILDRVAVAIELYCKAGDIIEGLRGSVGRATHTYGNRLLALEYFSTMLTEEKLSDKERKECGEMIAYHAAQIRRRYEIFTPLINRRKYPHSPVTASRVIEKAMEWIRRDVQSDLLTESRDRRQIEEWQGKLDSIELKVENSIPALRESSEVISLALFELIRNAILYSSMKLPIKINARHDPEDQKAVINIANYSDETVDRRKLFINSYRGVLARAATPEGTGYGLPSVKEMLENVYVGGKLSILPETDDSRLFEFEIRVPLYRLKPSESN